MSLVLSICAKVKAPLSQLQIMILIKQSAYSAKSKAMRCFFETG